MTFMTLGFFYYMANRRGRLLGTLLSGRGSWSDGLQAWLRCFGLLCGAVLVEQRCGCLLPRFQRTVSAAHRLKTACSGLAFPLVPTPEARHRRVGLVQSCTAELAIHAGRSPQVRPAPGWSA